MIDVTEVGVECACGRIRGKSAKPWRQCECGQVLCLYCRPRSMEKVECNACWNRKYKEEMSKKESTPVQCRVCEKEFLPKDMQNPHVPTICKDCHEIAEKVKKLQVAENKKRNAKPGLVEVVYGEFVPEQDGGSGYAYHNGGLDLELGDIVTVPPNWLDREIKGVYDHHKATVVSTYSDYNREVSTISGLVRKALKQGD